MSVHGPSLLIITKLFHWYLKMFGFSGSLLANVVNKEFPSKELTQFATINQKQTWLSLLIA